MIDASKISVGDAITIHVRVVRCYDDGTFHVESECGLDGAVGIDEIATHTPAPRAFKKGDRVTWGNGSVVYQFRDQQNGHAAIWHRQHGYRIEPVNALRHADEGQSND